MSTEGLQFLVREVFESWPMAQEEEKNKSKLQMFPDSRGETIARDELLERRMSCKTAKRRSKSLFEVKTL